MPSGWPRRDVQLAIDDLADHVIGKREKILEGSRAPGTAGSRHGINIAPGAIQMSISDVR